MDRFWLGCSCLRRLSLPLFSAATGQSVSDRRVGARGWGAYTAVLTDPQYLRSLVSTVALAAATTVATLFISGITGVFLTRARFHGRALLAALLTLPLAFPGVVIGFMVIMLAVGRV